MRKMVALIAAMTCAACLRADALAQTTGSVEGQVLSAASNLPVDAVLITATGSDVSRQTTTDEHGRYRLVDLPAGAIVIRVERIGYAPREEVVVIASGDTTRLSMTLDVAPLVLDSVAGAARRLVPYLGGFWERRERNTGYFFTRGDIEGARPNRVVDLFRGIPGARIASTSVGGGHIVSFGRLSSNAVCAAAVYVDGQPYEMSMAGLGDFRPDDIEAMEVYTGPSRVPPQFNATGRVGRPDVSIMGSPQCGVVVIWTRR